MARFFFDNFEKAIIGFYINKGYYLLKIVGRRREG